MNYVAIGSAVLFEHKNARVIEEERIQGRPFAVLALEDGRRVSVPWLEIKRNGSRFFVTPDGHAVAAAIAAAEMALQEIRGHEDEAARFMDWLRRNAATYDDKALGKIVRHVMEKL